MAPRKRPSPATASSTRSKKAARRTTGKAAPSVKAKRDPAVPTMEPALRTIAMPADTNPRGDIFGGWLLGQMDLAGGNAAAQRAHGRVATVAIEGMTFHRPVYVGDEVSCYARLVRIGRTSMAYHLETWVRRREDGRQEKVTEGIFTFVCIDENGLPRPVPPE